MSALVIGMLALLLVSLAAPSGVAAADSAFSAAEPKLAANHCLEKSDADYGAFSHCWAENMAANPELMTASRYDGSAISATDVTRVADNPELMAATRAMSVQR
jgi:hypothetical protein